MAGNDYFINIAPNSTACLETVCMLNTSQIENCIIKNDGYTENEDFSSIYVMFNDPIELNVKKSNRLATAESTAKETSKYLAECINKSGHFKTIENIACVQTKFLNVEEAIDEVEFCIRFTKVIDKKEALNVKEYIKNKIVGKFRQIYEKKDYMFFVKIKNFNLSRMELMENIKTNNKWINSHSNPKIYRVDGSGSPDKNLYGQFCDLSIYTEKTLEKLPKAIEILDRNGKKKIFDIEILQWGQRIPEKNNPEVDTKKGQKSLLTCFHFQRNTCVSKYKDADGKCIYQHIMKEKNVNEIPKRKEDSENENNNPMEGNNTSDERNNNLMADNKIIDVKIRKEDSEYENNNPMGGNNTSDERFNNLMDDIKIIDGEIIDDLNVSRISSDDNIIIGSSSPERTGTYSDLNAPTFVEGQEEHPDKNKINNNKLTLGTEFETVREPVSCKFNSYDTTKDDPEDVWITPDKKNKKKNKKKQNNSERLTDMSKNKETVPQATQVRRLPVKPNFKNSRGETGVETLSRIDTPKRKLISPITSVGKKGPSDEQISPCGKVNQS